MEKDKKNEEVEKNQILYLLDLQQKIWANTKIWEYVKLKESVFTNKVETEYLDNYILTKNINEKNWKIYFDVIINKKKFISYLEIIAKSNRVLINILWETIDLEFNSLRDIYKFIKVTEKILDTALRNEEYKLYWKWELKTYEYLFIEIKYLSKENFDFISDNDKEKYKVFLNSILQKLKLYNIEKWSKIIDLSNLSDSLTSKFVLEYKSIKDKIYNDLKWKNFKEIYNYYKNNNLDDLSFKFNVNNYISLVILEKLYNEGIKDSEGNIKEVFKYIFPKYIEVNIDNTKLSDRNDIFITLKVNKKQKIWDKIIFKIEWKNKKDIGEIKIPEYYYNIFVLWYKPL